MPPSRTRRRKAHSTSPPKPRVDAALDKPARTQIDSVLKDLRAISKLFSTTIPAIRAELRVLERLYYKNKNQHRSALFWRKVEELRKYGKRVDKEVGTGELVDALRGQFYGGVVEGGLNPKVLKGPWTHVPDVRFTLNTIRQAQIASDLIAKARVRNQAIHHAFTLAMQTGAFLQLILVLMAILCRIDLLLQEVADALSTLSSAMHLLMGILDKNFTSSATKPTESATTIANPNYSKIPSTQRQGAILANPCLQHTLDQYSHMSVEDLGQAVQRLDSGATSPEFTNDLSRPFMNKQQLSSSRAISSVPSGAEVAISLAPTSSTGPIAMEVDDPDDLAEHLETSFPKSATRRGTTAARGLDDSHNNASNVSFSSVSNATGSDAVVPSEITVTESRLTPLTPPASISLPAMATKPLPSLRSTSQQVKSEAGAVNNAPKKKTKKKKRSKDEIDDIFGGL